MSQTAGYPLLFARLRWRLWHNSLRALLRQSSLRPLSILLTSFVVWAFVFTISYTGFRFLRQQNFEGGIIEVLFDLLFFALGGLLVFSSGLILYSSLFNSQETAFLLSSPAPADQIYAFKYQGAVAFSSWAFLLLGGPILIAYGLVQVAPWHFYVLLALFFVGFVLIPGSLGALVCLLVVNFLPRGRKQLVLFAVVVLTLPAALWIYQSLSSLRHENLTRDAVQRILGRFGLASSPLMPSHWVAAGMLASARGQTTKAGYFLALVWSNGLFFYVLTAWLSRRLYRRGFNRLTTGGTPRRRFGGHALDRGLDRLLFFVDPQVRLLIVKDFRTFRRDPAQWAQVLIFSALMVLYFVNIRRLFVSEITWAYQNGISLLNLCAVALLLCTYTGRFIYPMLSLEGRKFWVLGLLPLRRERLLWGKFTFSAVGSLLIAEALILVSDLMLGMPPLLVGLHVLTVAVLAAGLSGLSVGLGACMPNFRETDPSKIASGLGGTLNLVAGLGYLLLIVGLMAFPWHGFAVAEEGEVRSALGLTAVAGGAAVGLLAGALAVFLPLHYGARNLRAMEF